MNTMTYEGIVFYSLEASEETLKEGVQFGKGYYISECGKVLSVKGRKPRVIKGVKNNYGYLCINLHQDGKRKNFLIHRLVASYFIPNPNNYSCVNHKDECKTNNHVSNLEHCTYKYNLEYSGNTKKACESAIKNQTWKKAHESNKKKIKAFNYFTNEFIGEFESVKEAGKKLEVTKESISKNLIGKLKKVGTRKGVIPKTYYYFEYSN